MNYGPDEKTSFFNPSPFIDCCLFLLSIFSLPFLLDHPLCHLPASIRILFNDCFYLFLYACAWLPSSLSHVLAQIKHLHVACSFYLRLQSPQFGFCMDSLLATSYGIAIFSSFWSLVLSRRKFWWQILPLDIIIVLYTVSFIFLR